MKIENLLKLNFYTKNEKEISTVEIFLEMIYNMGINSYSNK